MKAILNVKKYSPYAKYNGLTFEVNTFNYNFFVLVIDGVCVDFTHKEIILVDVQNEIQQAYDSHNWDGSGTKDYNRLKKYCELNNIEFTPKYNCPA